MKANNHQFSGSPEVVEVTLPQSHVATRLWSHAVLWSFYLSLLANFPVRIIGYILFCSRFHCLLSAMQYWLHCYWLKYGAASLNAITCPNGGGVRENRGQREVVRLCRLLPDERPCPRNIRFYYLFKGCFHDTAISNPAWWGHKIIAGLFGRTCFIWHILGMASTKKENKVVMFMAAELSVHW